MGDPDVEGGHDHPVAALDELLDEALAWRLVWLMAPEIGVGPFVV